MAKITNNMTVIVTSVVNIMISALGMPVVVDLEDVLVGIMVMIDEETIISEADGEVEIVLVVMVFIIMAKAE